MVEGSKNVVVGDLTSHDSSKIKTKSESHKISVRAIFHDGTPLANEDYKIVKGGITIRTGKTNTQGMISERNIPAGEYEIEIGNHWIVEA